MWEPRPLTLLWAFTACYRDSFTLLLPYIHIYFFFQRLFQPIQGPGLLFSSVIIFSQTVGLLGRVIRPSQGRYLNTGEHKQNKRIHTPNIHALSVNRTYDFSVRASEESSCFRPRGYCDRHQYTVRVMKLRRMRRSGLVARVGELREFTRSFDRRTWRKYFGPGKGQCSRVSWSTWGRRLDSCMSR
jgi:hypothetical protein